MDNCLNGVLVGIPEDISNLQLPNPELRDYYRDEQDRIFWLNDSVENCAEDLIRMILYCNKEDKGKSSDERKPIKIFIDSLGGDLTFMYSIINMIDISKTPIWTINYCTSYSAAGEILASGHKRFAFPGSHVMLHNGSASFGGQVDQVESMKRYFDSVSKKCTEHLLSKTKIDPKKLKKRGVTDWFMDENEALENGVIDEIVTDFDELF